MKIQHPNQTAYRDSLDNPHTPAPHRNPYFHRLADEVTTLAAHINAAQCEWLLLVAEFDRVEAWKMDCGIANTADWLAWKCRFGKGTAREKVRVARALVELPKIRDAFAAGELSYSVVRELTRIATPTREDSLLNVCRHGTASHVERLVRHVRRIDRQADTESSFQVWDERRASWWERDDGMVEIRMVLAPDQGRTVVAALDTLVKSIRDEAAIESEAISELSSKSTSENPIAQIRADAIERLAELALGTRSDATLTGALTGGDLTTLQIDVDQLVDADSEDVPRGALSRLSCDCAVIASVTDARTRSTSVGRKTRVVPAAMRRALERRDVGCTFPGCSNHRHVDAHHIVHWAHGGETRLDNLTLLCRRHHRLVHEGGFRVTMTSDHRPLFFSPSGNQIAHAPVADVPAGTLQTHHTSNGIRIDARTTQSLWDGRPPDWAMMVDGVLMYD